MFLEADFQKLFQGVAFIRSTSSPSIEEEDSIYNLNDPLLDFQPPGVLSSPAIRL